ncbi:MAG: uroporphyrinogen decarboxylase family protein, partial [Anaerolineae bacterium]
GYHSSATYQVPVTAYEGVAALGGELVYPRDHQPMIRNQGHVLPEDRVPDVMPDPWQNNRFQLHLAQYHELERRFPGQVVRGGLAGQEGPVTTAGLLSGQRFFEACLCDPPAAHRLIDLCTNLNISWYRAEDQALGTHHRVAGIADDYAGLLSPALWPEFVLPYYQRLCAELGPDGCALHSELLRETHLPLLHHLPLVSLNLGENQYLGPEQVARELPDVPFGWHLKAVSEMQQGKHSSIKQRYRELVTCGVKHVLVELTVGTPPANVRAFLEIAQENS